MVLPVIRASVSIALRQGKRHHGASGAQDDSLPVATCLDNCRDIPQVDRVSAFLLAAALLFFSSKTLLFCPELSLL